MYSVTEDSVKTRNTRYALNDPRNPDCPCHKYQQMAEKEYALLKRKELVKEIPKALIKPKLALVDHTKIIEPEKTKIAEPVTLLNSLSALDNEEQAIKKYTPTNVKLESETLFVPSATNKNGRTKNEAKPKRKIGVVKKIKFKLLKQSNLKFYKHKHKRCDDCFNW